MGHPRRRFHCGSGSAHTMTSRGVVLFVRVLLCVVGDCAVLIAGVASWGWARVDRPEIRLKLDNWSMTAA